MTREDAIQILADLTDSPFLHTWEKQNKALHMAIEALSAETVSRFHLDMEIKELKHQIKDQADAEWIPCSERLPSESGWYLITVQGCEKVADMGWYYGERDVWEGVSSEQQVIAWMPLPKPYKGGDAE